MHTARLRIGLVCNSSFTQEYGEIWYTESVKVIILFLVVLGLILGIRYTVYLETIKVYRVGDTFGETVTLLTEPKSTFYRQTFQLEGLTIELPKHPAYEYGDKLKIVGIVSESSFQTKTGITVAQLVVKNPRIQVLGSHNVFVKSAAFLRQRIFNTFNSYLPSDAAGLLFGIVFGGSQGITGDTREAFRSTGVLHVVAASGMNISMVAAFFIAIFSRLFRRRTALILSIGGVFYYALFSGFSPSIVRASIMASIAFSAGILGRQNYGILTLFLTGFLMLMIQPETLFDVGFQLSFTSTGGILLIKPLFDKIKLMKKTKAVSDDITTSLSAQLGSVPVMVAVFGSYSFISIFINALVLWTIPFLMILGGIAALCAITIPIAAVPALYLSYPLLLYFEKVVLLFKEVPLLQLEAIPASLIVGYYLLLLAIVLYIGKKRG